MRTYDDGSHIDYTYSADGVKLRADYYLNPYTPAVPDGEFGIACDSSLLVHTWREYAGNGTYDARTDLTLKRYAYVYRYDERLNCVEKRMPGCEPIRYAYDRTGTKVFSQDGNQRQRGVWSFALLDRFGREAVTGECQNPDSVALAEKWVHVDTPDFAARESTLGGSGYRSNVNLGNVRLLTANYYDDYTFISALWPDHNLPLPTTSGLRGLQTGSINAVGNTMDYNTTLIGYDDEGRINFTQSAIAGRTMTEEKNYTLDGRVSQIRKETTEADGNRHTETYSYRYDAQARLLKVTHSLDGGAEMTLSDNEYDELGRLLTDRREGSGLLTARYSYDIHSHIRKMVSPLFCQRLFYAEPSEGGIPLYGGAISGMDWQTIGDSVRSFRYQYDGLGRLTSADYLESGHSSDRYVTEYSYDLMGNILTLSRSGKVYDEIYGITDDLTYQYDGNRLIRVTNHAADTPAYKDAMYYADGADLDTERTYDANGNMTSNADSRISRISYDALNMPCRIDYIDGSHIDYTYAADGVKQRVDYYLNPYTSSLPDDDLGTACDSSLLVHTWREYAGNCVYVCDTLSMILINGGYITFDYTTHQPIYHYYLKDYLGNNRITVSLADGRIEEVNHYYPFGGLMGDSRNATTQPYKYIGKELDRTHGLDWYDHGARHYDPVTGRWNTMDKLCEEYYEESPYASCHDNPMHYKDENGKIPFESSVANKGVSSRFGRRFHPIKKKWIFHGGVDLRAKMGTPVHVVADGIIEKVKNNPTGYGLYVIVAHKDNYKSLYAHLDGTDMKVGDTVHENDIIGNSGNSGSSTAPHLHIEYGINNILQSENKINPEEIDDMQVFLNNKNNKQEEIIVMLPEVIVVAPACPRDKGELLIPTFNTNINYDDYKK